MQNTGSSLETTGLYFQAALKFLHAASLLESGNNDSAKYSEMNQAKLMYSSTAKLCEYVNIYPSYIMYELCLCGFFS